MSCSPFSKQNSLSTQIQEKINSHPCYSESAHQHYARIHLAVAPACNIQCNYCNRKYDCSNESRPGVTSAKLSVEDSIKKVLYVGADISKLSVVGIAGPGDALANPKNTFKTFELLQQKAPDLKLCLSTNGLRIVDYIDEIVKYNIDHVTVTINTVDTSGEIGSKIYPWIYYNKKKIWGAPAARILLEKQLEGIKMLTDRGILVKANSVLIKDINDKDLPNVAKKMKELNVFVHNIMPLLSSPEFGTKFGLEGIPTTTDQEVMQAQKACGIDMKLMRHCRQCRADAVGLIGEDRGSEFSKDKFSSMNFKELEEKYDVEDRRKKHKIIEDWRKNLDLANQRVKLEKASKKELSSNGKTKLVAVTTSGEGMINMHFGSAQEFLIYEAGDKAIKFIMHRKIPSSYSGSDYEKDFNPINEIKDSLKDCDILLTAKLGECPMNDLNKIGIICDESYANKTIEKSILNSVQKHFYTQERKIS